MVLITSCSNKKKAIDEYCNCMSSIVSDSLLSNDLITITHKKCFDSIIQKYKLNNNNEFLSTFDSVEKVKNLRKTTNTKVIQNIEKLIENRYFDYMNFWNNSYVRYEFDGKMVTITAYEMPFIGAGWQEKEKFTGVYKIENENNGKIHITLTSSNHNSVYEFVKGNKNDYNYLLKEKMIEKKDYPVYFLKGVKNLYSRKK